MVLTTADVDAMIHAGATLSRVEDEIDAAAEQISEERQAALWLYAWSTLPPRVQRAEALEMERQLAPR